MGSRGRSAEDRQGDRSPGGRGKEARPRTAAGGGKEGEPEGPREKLCGRMKARAENGTGLLRTVARRAAAVRKETPLLPPPLPRQASRRCPPRARVPSSLPPSPAIIFSGLPPPREVANTASGKETPARNLGLTAKPAVSLSP